MSNFRPDRVDFVERRTFLKEIAPTESIFIRSPRWEAVKPPLIGGLSRKKVRFGKEGLLSRFRFFPHSLPDIADAEQIEVFRPGIGTGDLPG